MHDRSQPPGSCSALRLTAIRLVRFDMQYTTARAVHERLHSRTLKANSRPGGDARPLARDRRIERGWVREGRTDSEAYSGRPCLKFPCSLRCKRCVACNGEPQVKLQIFANETGSPSIFGYFPSLESNEYFAPMTVQKRIKSQERVLI